MGRDGETNNGVLFTFLAIYSSHIAYHEVNVHFESD